MTIILISQADVSKLLPKQTLVALNLTGTMHALKAELAINQSNYFESNPA